MQITEKLNDQQRLMSLADKQMLCKCYPIFNEMEKEGYDVDFYYVRGRGAITIVPSTNRIRIKVRDDRLNDLVYLNWLVVRLEAFYKNRTDKKDYLEGIKISRGFKEKRGKK